MRACPRCGNSVENTDGWPTCSPGWAAYAWWRSRASPDCPVVPWWAPQLVQNTASGTCLLQWSQVTLSLLVGRSAGGVVVRAGWSRRLGSPLSTVWPDRLGEQVVEHTGAVDGARLVAVLGVRDGHDAHGDRHVALMCRQDGDPDLGGGAAADGEVAAVHGARPRDL